MGTEVFKIKEDMTEKMKPKVGNPPSKNGENSLLNPITEEGGHIMPPPHLLYEILL